MPRSGTMRRRRGDGVRPRRWTDPGPRDLRKAPGAGLDHVAVGHWKADRRSMVRPLGRTLPASGSSRCIGRMRHRAQGSGVPGPARRVRPQRHMHGTPSSPFPPFWTRHSAVQGPLGLTNKEIKYKPEATQSQADCPQQRPPPLPGPGAVLMSKDVQIAQIRGVSATPDPSRHGVSGGSGGWGRGGGLPKLVRFVGHFRVSRPMPSIRNAHKWGEPPFTVHDE